MTQTLTIYVSFLGFYDGLSCFPLNEAHIYVGKNTSLR
jgi:hypothetical protein